MPRKFDIAAAAGTFDHFHRGHEQFLLAAFDLADRVYIGITSDTFAASTRQQGTITPFSQRKKEVEAFLRTQKVTRRAKVFELHNVQGPILEPDCLIQAIVVTEKTQYGAALINTLRQKKGLVPLAIEKVDLQKALDGGELSSSRIRAGEIDREGRLWIKPEWLGKTLQLPDTLRPLLQKPVDRLIKGSEEHLEEAITVVKQVMHSRSEKNLTVSVGDVVTKSFNEHEIPIDLAIVDFVVKREERFTNIRELGFTKNQPDAIVTNPKGTLTPETFKAVKDAFSRGEMPNQVRHDRGEPYIIRIVGEEDLATLAAILAAPLNTHVYYGQPHEGIVDVTVTEEKKSEVRDIVSQFTS